MKCCNSKFFYLGKIKYFEMLSAEILTQHAKVTTKVFNACNLLLLHSNRESQAQPVHPHSLIWIFSGLLLSIHVFYSIRQFKRTTVLIRLNDDKVLIYQCNILFIANIYKRKKEKILCLPKTF